MPLDNQLRSSRLRNIVKNLEQELQNVEGCPSWSKLMVAKIKIIDVVLELENSMDSSSVCFKESRYRDKLV